MSALDLADAEARAAREFEAEQAAFVKDILERGFSEPDDDDDTPAEMPADVRAQKALLERVLKAKRQTKKNLGELLMVTGTTISNRLRNCTHLDEMLAAAERLPTLDKRSYKQRRRPSAAETNPTLPAPTGAPQPQTPAPKPPAPAEINLSRAAATHATQPAPHLTVDQIRAAIRRLSPEDRAELDTWYAPQAIIAQRIADLTAERNRLLEESQ